MERAHSDPQLIVGHPSRTRIVTVPGPDGKPPPPIPAGAARLSCPRFPVTSGLPARVEA